MLGLQEQNQMNLLGYVLKEFSMKHLYDLNLFYQDIVHIKTVHLNDQEKVKEYILSTSNKIKNCVIRLACWSLRRYTRSETEQSSMIASPNIQNKNIHAKIEKAGKEANLMLTIVEKQLDKLHCDIFHYISYEKQKVNFRRLYVDHNNYSHESVQDLINYIHDITFECNKSSDNEIKSKLARLFNNFHITPQILHQAPQNDVEDLIRHNSGIEKVESKLLGILMTLKTQTRVKCVPTKAKKK
eukprot:76271_1